MTCEAGEGAWFNIVPAFTQSERFFAGAVKDVAAIFGLHVWPFIPSGTLASRAGPIMGACQQFQVPQNIS